MILERFYSMKNKSVIIEGQKVSQGTVTDFDGLCPGGAGCDQTGYGAAGRHAGRQSAGLSAAGDAGLAGAQLMRLRAGV